MTNILFFSFFFYVSNCFQGWTMAEYQQVFLRLTCPLGLQEEGGKISCTSYWLEQPALVEEYMWVSSVCHDMHYIENHKWSIGHEQLLLFAGFHVKHLLPERWQSTLNLIGRFFCFDRRTKLSRETNKDIRTVLQKFHPDHTKQPQNKQPLTSRQRLLVSNLFTDFVIIKCWNLLFS